mmetsp:Transcript_22727/g.26333  ORF Transcript_22727/g.26333 Transcript_22727/m.26333 type:complete len:413 (+) Transcript_22727:125-1363(+)
MASSIASRCMSAYISSQLKTKLSSVSLGHNEKLCNTLANMCTVSSSTYVPMAISSSPRFFSSGNSDNDSKERGGITEDNEDPFGVNYEDSDSNIGPKDGLPPNYVRDSTTGKFTGKIQQELSPEEAHLLKLSPIGKGRRLTKRFEEALEKEKLLHASKRIREQDVAMNALGRDVSEVSEVFVSEKTEEKFTAPLSESEFQSLGKFMQKNAVGATEEKIVDGLLRKAKEEDLIPIARKSSAKHPSSMSTKDEDNPDLDLEWMKASAQRSMLDIDEEDLDDPFASLMPSDLNPSQKVNRKRAKLIPKQLLHHNNLALLRRYVTPGGQIMNRIQTRLGAKDQRKIATLVKRARHLGLVPVLGQWKVEDHGSIKENDIFENRQWEEELLERGLVEGKSEVYGKKGGKSDSGRSIMW